MRVASPPDSLKVLHVLHVGVGVLSPHTQGIPLERTPTPRVGKAAVPHAGPLQRAAGPLAFPLQAPAAAGRLPPV